MSDLLSSIRWRMAHARSEPVPALAPPTPANQAGVRRRNTVTLLLPGWTALHVPCHLPSVQDAATPCLSLAVPPGWRVKPVPGGITLANGIVCRMEVTVLHLPHGRRLTHAESLRRLVREASAAWGTLGPFVVWEQVVWYGTVYTGYYCRGQAKVLLGSEQVAVSVLHMRIPVGNWRLDVLALLPTGPGLQLTSWTLPERIADTLRLA